MDNRLDCLEMNLGEEKVNRLLQSCRPEVMLSQTWETRGGKEEKEVEAIQRYIRENRQGDSRCKDVMEQEVSTEVLSILNYTTENTLLTFIEIGNTR